MACDDCAKLDEGQFCPSCSAAQAQALATPPGGIGVNEVEDRSRLVLFGLVALGPLLILVWMLSLYF